MWREGLSVFLRKIQKRHGTPADFAARYADTGLQWILIGGPWHDAKGPRFINEPKTCRRYADALAKRSVQPWVWGYPWQGTEELWCAQMRECAGDHAAACINAELGANPARSRQPRAMAKANVHAQAIVEGLRAQRFEQFYLSTYGGVTRIPWYPLQAYLRHLDAAASVHGALFGGQLYLDNRVIDVSLADYMHAIQDRRIELVPGYGLYRFTDRTRKKAVPKTPAELLTHLCEFVDDDEPVYAAAGWAENFLGRTIGQGPLWATLIKFNGWMLRGACTL